jgi:hypothetical protein
MTVPLIEVETLDFVAASRMLRLWVAEPLELAVRGLWGTLDGCAGMAGRDPGGGAWAASYDRAAAVALSATADAINGVDQLSSMFAQTARNYEAADIASTPATHRVMEASVATLPCVPGFVLPSCTPASALGGSGGGPSGWGLIEGLVGYVWPNGHQDHLHAAASAWRRSAAALAHAADDTVAASEHAVADGLPEADDIWTVCNGMSSHLRELSSVHAALGDACSELAHHIDRMHSEVIGELESLIEWSAGIQAAGGLLSAVTFGLAEVPTQAVQAARLAKVAATVGAIIERFIGVARALAASVGALVDRAAVVSSRLRLILGAPLAVATTTVVGRVRMIREIGTEVGAIGRLEADSTHIAMRYVDNPRLFDPQALRGMKMDNVRAGIPKTWRMTPSRRGNGHVFEDPANRGRQIRLMPGYPVGSRPDLVSTGPYAVVSQLGKQPIKVPLEGNPSLP